MMERQIRFEADPSLDHIEVIIRGPARDEAVQGLMDRLAEPPSGGLPVYDREGNLHTLAASEIISVTMESKLLHVITADGIWYARRSLQSMEESLDSARFVRISRYELVNLDKVMRYDFTLAGTLRLELTGGMETWASRRCIPDIRKRLQGKE